MDHDGSMFVVDADKTARDEIAERKKRKRKEKDKQKRKKAYKVRELREVQSFVDRMISMAVLALGLLHGRAIAGGNEFVAVTLKLVVMLVILYAVQRYALDAATKSPLYTRVWWKSLYRITALMQDYFVSIVTYVLNATLFDGMVRSNFNITEITRLFLVVATLVFMSDVLPNIRAGVWLNSDDRP